MRPASLLPLLLALVASTTASVLALEPSATNAARTKASPASEAVGIRAESVAALEKLNSDSTTPWEVRWDGATGLPARIYGGSTEPLGATPEEAARAFLKRHSAVFAIASADRDLRTMEIRESLGGRHVRFLQHLRGLPVFGADVSVHMDRSLAVHTVNSAYVPLQGTADMAATVTREAALERARSAARVEGELRAPASADKVLFARDGKAAIAWLVMLPARSPLGDFQVVVDASSAEVLSLENLIRHAEAKAKVFNPNPVVAMKNNSFRDGNDADNSAWAGAYKEVTLQGLDSSGKLRGQFVDATLGTLAEEEPQAGPYNFTRNQKPFEQVMVYFHIDRAQRYIQSIGFTNINNRVQRANAHGTNDDNSWFSPATKELTFGDGGVDDAEDSDIIMHEYGHSIQDNQVPGFGGRGEAGAMGEGFGDYMASTMRADLTFQRECVGSWDGVAYSSDNPPCLRRVDSTKHYPEQIEGEVHADGEIWSASVWQLWNKLGKAVTDKLVLESHFHLSPQAKFADGANAILQADKSLFQGAHLKEIKQVFVARGILKSSAKLRISLKDKATGKPCAGRVNVSGLQASLQVPAGGLLEAEIAPGAYTMSVSSFGYLTQDGRAVEVQEDQTVDVEFVLESAPRFAVTGSVKRADTGEAVSARIYVADTPIEPVQTSGSAGTFSVELPAGKYTFKAVAFGFRASVLADVEIAGPRSLEFKLASLPPVLLVDDDDGASVETFFKAALTAGQFDVWTVKSDGQLTDDGLLGYPTVVWFTGADYRQTLSEQDQALIKQYLQAGGRLMLSGQEIAYSLKDTSFLKDVLAAEFVADAASVRKVKGASMEFAIEGGDGANNQQYPDVVKAAGAGSREYFAYDGDASGSAALALVRSGAKALYFAFGFEAIDTAANRAKVMKLALDFLRPTLAERASRLAAMDAMRQAAPAAEQTRWMALEESYEKLIAGELASASAADQARLRDLLARPAMAKFRILRTAGQ
ncbi:MAG: M36 family metallopeptidase [Candidatus Wallbacteria bacterium]|nr:M36 family metallopeptidase [Candidatus Wallbacteria bacterium]